MIHAAIDPTQPKGWFLGPWNSDVPIPIGYANQGINEKHYHAQMYEIYLVACGSSLVQVNDQEIVLQAGEMLVVAPHEVHTFLDSSLDYVHFVIQAPFVQNDKISVE